MEPGPRKPNTVVVTVGRYRAEIVVRAPGTWWAAVAGSEVVYVGMFNPNTAINMSLYGITHREEGEVRLKKDDGTMDMKVAEASKSSILPTV